jgi:hypothetical protein
MMVGRDRYTGPRTPLAAFGVEPAPRDNLWSRWTQGLRQKFDRAFAKPESVTTEPLESADTVPAEQDRPASAASSEAPITAGEAWYNRKWR